MRAALLAVISAIAVAGCSPGGGASGQAGAGGGDGFPTFSATAYRLEGTMSLGGQTVSQVRYQDGPKSRAEMDGAMGHMIMVMDASTRKGFQLMTIGGQIMATRIDYSQEDANAPSQMDMSQMRDRLKARSHRVGACSAAGENGTEWEVTSDDSAATTTDTSSHFTMCLTNDGIPLQMKVNGEVMFNTTAIQRGPQDPNLFTPPAGVHFTDVHTPSQAEINAMAARARAAAAQYGTH